MNRVRLFLALGLVALLLPANVALAQSARPADKPAAGVATPDDVQGMSRARLARIAPSMKDQIDSNIFPGAVTLIARCDIGFWRGQGLSMGDYVTGTGPTDGATAVGGGLVLPMLIMLADGSGNVRAPLAFAPSGSASLSFAATDGEPRAIMIVMPDSTSHLRFYSKDGKVLWKVP